MGTVRWTLDAVDAADAEESLRRVSPNVELGRAPDPRHRLRFAADDRFALLRLDVAGEMWGTNEPDDTITVPYVVSGRMEWQVGEERGKANLPWLQGTTAPTFSRFGPAVELATFLQKGPLREFGRALYGDDRFALDFSAATGRSEAAARALASVLTLAHQMAAMDVFDQSLVRASIYRLVAISVFDTFRLEGDQRARMHTAQGRLARYRRAAQFIDDFASLPITVEDVAAAVEVNAAELDEIFRGHALDGRGVGDRLRAARLAAAHEDLVRGDPTLGDTVRDIAHRWGFASPSRFAALYRETYGTNPKWVLDR